MSWFASDAAMVWKLVVKDWQVYQKQLAGFVAGMLLALGLVGMGTPLMASAGALLLLVQLLDVRMQPLSGPVTFEQLKALGCPWPVLFLTGHGDVGTAVGAVKNGAWDFLEKPFQDNMLVDRVEQAMQAACAQTDAEREAQRLRQALASLSPREREVLDQLILGHYNKNIADHLGITQRTVEFHRANIFEKMGVESAIELAHKLGRLEPMPGGESK